MCPHTKVPSTSATKRMQLLRVGKSDAVQSRGVKQVNVWAGPGET